jgi:hypothetical protein
MLSFYLIKEKEIEFNSEIAKLKLKIKSDEDYSDFFKKVNDYAIKRMLNKVDELKFDVDYQHYCKIHIKKQKKIKRKHKRMMWFRKWKEKIFKPIDKIIWTYEFISDFIITTYNEIKEYYEIKKIEKYIVGYDRIRITSFGHKPRYVNLNSEETFKIARGIRKGVHLSKRMELITNS